MNVSEKTYNTVNKTYIFCIITMISLFVLFIICAILENVLLMELTKGLIFTVLGFSTEIHFLLTTIEKEQKQILKLKSKQSLDRKGIGKTNSIIKYCFKNGIDYQPLTEEDIERQKWRYH